MGNKETTQGITSRKIFNTGNQRYKILGRREWGEGDQHWVLSYSTAGVDLITVRKLLHPESEVTGNDMKSLPMPQLPCNLEADNCHRHSLESSFTAKMHICRTLMSARHCCQRNNVTFPMPFKSQACLSLQNTTLPELCWQRTLGNTASTIQMIPHTNNLIIVIYICKASAVKVLWGKQELSTEELSDVSIVGWVATRSDAHIPNREHVALCQCSSESYFFP